MKKIKVYTYRATSKSWLSWSQELFWSDRNILHCQDVLAIAAAVRRGEADRGPADQPGGGPHQPGRRAAGPRHCSPAHRRRVRHQVQQQAKTGEKSFLKTLLGTVQSLSYS